MLLRKKKTVRDQLEDRLDDFLAQAGTLREQIAERAPEVRDAMLIKADQGLRELRDHLPELSEETYDRLPTGVADRLPDEVKPKKRRLRKVLGLGLLAGAGAAVFATMRGKQGPPPPPPTSTVPPPAPAAGGGPVDPARSTAPDGSAPPL